MDARTSMIFSFSVGNSLFEQIWSKKKKIKTVSVGWNFVLRIIRIYRIQWHCSLFLFYWNHPFWVNLFQKIKIVSLRGNYVPRLIRICRIQWRYSIFLFRPETPFLGKFGPKNQNCQFKLKFGTRLIQICRIQWWCSFFLFCTGNTLFNKRSVVL